MLPCLPSRGGARVQPSVGFVYDEGEWLADQALCPGGNVLALVERQWRPQNGDMFVGGKRVDVGNGDACLQILLQTESDPEPGQHG